MPTSDSPLDSRRIRVLNGPLRGATFVLSRRVTMGRSCEADVQLLDNGVSRQHAQIVESPDGRHILVDLDSTNGTFVDGRRVRRHVLKLGTIFKIMRSKVVYEATPPVVVEDDDASGMVERRTNGQSLRATVAYGVADLPGPMVPRRDADAPQPREVRDDTNTVAAESRGHERHRIEATLPDGLPYPGDVLEDIVSYRSLRTRVLRGEYTTEPETRRLRALERRLRAQPRGEQGNRQYYRFDCRVPANLRLVAGSARSVIVVDIAVDGAKMLAPGHDVARNTLVWLAVAVVAHGQPQTLVFPGRVVWVDTNRLGVSFSGTPGWSRRGNRESSENTIVGREPAAPREPLGTMTLEQLRIDAQQQQTER